jgi:hypothetical protein
MEKPICISRKPWEKGEQRNCAIMAFRPTAGTPDAGGSAHRDGIPSARLQHGV